MAEGSYAGNDSWVKVFGLRTLTHKSYKQPWMSKLIMESHLQAYENLSQILTPYAVADIKTKWEQIGSRLLMRNDSISNTLYTSAHDFPKWRVMENHYFCFLISQVLGKFQFMKFRTQEEFIPTAWYSSEVDSKPKDCWWKPDSFLRASTSSVGNQKPVKTCHSFQ